MLFCFEQKISEAFYCLGFNIIKMCRLSCWGKTDYAKQPFDSTGWLDYDNQLLFSDFGVINI